MKVLAIVNGDEYEALMFEQRYPITLETWNRVNDGEEISVDLGDGETQVLDVEAFEFGEVDPEFIEFVREFIDYDQSKSSNFYIVPES
jgi:hypothetical protein